MRWTNEKTFLCIGIMAVIILAAGTGIHAYANAPKAKVFTGIDGKELTVHSNNFSATDTAENYTENESVKAGDIIDGSAGEEIVIGVSGDGQFITMSLADYQAEKNQ